MLAEDKLAMEQEAMEKTIMQITADEDMKM